MLSNGGEGGENDGDLDVHKQLSFAEQERHEQTPCSEREYTTTRPVSFRQNYNRKS